MPRYSRLVNTGRLMTRRPVRIASGASTSKGEKDKRSFGGVGNRTECNVSSQTHIRTHRLEQELDGCQNGFKLERDWRQ